MLTFSATFLYQLHLHLIINSFSANAEEKPAVNMKCERTCLTKCKLDFTANFEIKPAENISDAPGSHCYDPDSIKSLYPDEKDECEQALSKAEKHAVSIL